MLRLFLLTQFLLLNIYACKGGYSSCIAKVKDSHSVQNSSLSIPVKGDKRLLYSKQQPNAKILKYDPFLSLYLIKDKKKFKYPFDVNMRQQLGTAAVTDKSAQEGKFLKNQVGLDLLAHYSVRTEKPALITSSCCSLEGIATPNGVIQKEYIKRFLSSAPATYGDIGIRVKNEKGLVKVTASNPYIKNNPFQKKDIIVSFDGKRIAAASVFMRRVLFSKIGSLHTITLKRKGKLLRFKVTTKKRYGGGALSDTFLEQKGIYFDKTLHIIQLSNKLKKYGLHLGDQLVQMNSIGVDNQKELLKNSKKSNELSSLLFERKDFQFFVKIK